MFTFRIPLVDPVAVPTAESGHFSYSPIRILVPLTPIYAPGLLKKHLETFVHALPHSLYCCPHLPIVVGSLVGQPWRLPWHYR